MAGEDQISVWPLPKFYFSVKIESLDRPLLFQEVSGLNNEVKPLEFNNRGSQSISSFDLPGISKPENITLKKGIFPDKNKFYDWFNSINRNTISREIVVIELLDESGNLTMTWTLTNASPSKVSVTDLESNGSEMAIESIELVYEALTINQV
ncbi:phage tail protein [uncultured Cyclobacterium sp.]|uniref:phage tail protein n=1 Tax=uncultured Cyclobacterium sp. TaxID=453820 RepID=UPI0030EE0BF5